MINNIKRQRNGKGVGVRGGEYCQLQIYLNWVIRCRNVGGKEREKIIKGRKCSFLSHKRENAVSKNIEARGRMICGQNFFIF